MKKLISVWGTESGSGNYLPCLYVFGEFNENNECERYYSADTENAVGLFQEAGWAVELYPVDYRFQWTDGNIYDGFYSIVYNPATGNPFWYDLMADDANTVPVYLCRNDGQQHLLSGYVDNYLGDAVDSAVPYTQFKASEFPTYFVEYNEKALEIELSKVVYVGDIAYYNGQPYNPVQPPFPWELEKETEAQASTNEMAASVEAVVEATEEVAEETVTEPQLEVIEGGKAETETTETAEVVEPVVEEVVEETVKDTVEETVETAVEETAEPVVEEVVEETVEPVVEEVVEETNETTVEEVVEETNETTVEETEDELEEQAEAMLEQAEEEVQTEVIKEVPPTGGVTDILAELQAKQAEIASKENVVDDFQEEFQIEEEVEDDSETYEDYATQETEELDDSDDDDEVEEVNTNSTDDNVIVLTHSNPKGEYEGDKFIPMVIYHKDYSHLGEGVTNKAINTFLECVDTGTEHEFEDKVAYEAIVRHFRKYTDANITLIADQLHEAGFKAALKTEIIDESGEEHELYDGLLPTLYFFYISKKGETLGRGTVEFNQDSTITSALTAFMGVNLGAKAIKVEELTSDDEEEQEKLARENTVRIYQNIVTETARNAVELLRLSLAGGMNYSDLDRMSVIRYNQVQDFCNKWSNNEGVEIYHDIFTTIDGDDRAEVLITERGISILYDYDDAQIELAPNVVGYMYDQYTINTRKGLQDLGYNPDTDKRHSNRVDDEVKFNGIKYQAVKDLLSTDPNFAQVPQLLNSYQDIVEEQMDLAVDEFICVSSVAAKMKGDKNLREIGMLCRDLKGDPSVRVFLPSFGTFWGKLMYSTSKKANEQHIGKVRFVHPIKGVPLKEPNKINGQPTWFVRSEDTSRTNKRRGEHPEIRIGVEESEHTLDKVLEAINEGLQKEHNKVIKKVIAPKFLKDLNEMQIALAKQYKCFAGGDYNTKVDPKKEDLKRKSKALGERFAKINK